MPTSVLGCSHAADCECGGLTLFYHACCSKHRVMPTLLLRWPLLVRPGWEPSRVVMLVWLYLHRLHLRCLLCKLFKGPTTMRLQQVAVAGHTSKYGCAKIGSATMHLLHAAPSEAFYLISDRHTVLWSDSSSASTSNMMFTVNIITGGDHLAAAQHAWPSTSHVRHPTISTRMQDMRTHLRFVCTSRCNTLSVPCPA